MAGHLNSYDATVSEVHPIFDVTNVRREWVRKTNRWEPSADAEVATTKKDEALQEMRSIVKNGRFLHLKMDRLMRRAFIKKDGVMSPPEISGMPVTITYPHQVFLDNVTWITDKGTIKLPSVYLWKETENPNQNFLLLKLLREGNLTTELKDQILNEIDRLLA